MKLTNLLITSGKGTKTIKAFSKNQNKDKKGMFLGFLLLDSITLGSVRNIRIPVKEAPKHIPEADCLLHYKPDVGYRQVGSKVTSSGKKTTEVLSTILEGPDMSLGIEQLKPDNEGKPSFPVNIENNGAYVLAHRGVHRTSAKANHMLRAQTQPRAFTNNLNQVLKDHPQSYPYVRIQNSGGVSLKGVVDGIEVGDAKKIKHDYVNKVIPAETKKASRVLKENQDKVKMTWKSHSKQSVVDEDTEKESVIKNSRQGYKKTAIQMEDKEKPGVAKTETYISRNAYLRDSQGLSYNPVLNHPEGGKTKIQKEYSSVKSFKPVTQKETQAEIKNTAQLDWDVGVLKQVFKVHELERVVLQVAQSTRNNSSREIELKLEPESLGRVRIKVSCNQDKVDIVIKTHTNEAQNVLREGIDSLKENLLGKGLEVNHLSVNMESYMRKNGENHSHYNLDYNAGEEPLPENVEPEYDAQHRLAAIVAAVTGNSHYLNIIV